MDNFEILMEKFVQSWIEMEFFFERAIQEHNHDVPIIFKTIKSMRKEGYDKKFRAGQSLYKFCISRSKELGLREEQARICLIPGKDGWSNEEGEVRIIFSKNNLIEIDFRTSNPLESSDFINLITKLENEPIN